MALTYQTYYLPISVLTNFPHTFSYSNQKYKLLPQLTHSGLVKRVLIGYNRNYGENEKEKGKALYDTLKLTNEGVRYLEELGINNDSKLIRNFYRKQLTHNDPQIEERVKRSVETDMMFDGEFFIKEVFKSLNLTQGTMQSLLLDVSHNKNIKYYRAIECKRTNLDLNRMKEYTSIRDYTDSIGNSVSGSKFFGLLESENKEVPVYNAGYYNVHVKAKNEEDLADKITAESSRRCRTCAYIYHDANKIKSLIDMDIGDYEWRKNKTLFDVKNYQEIYLLPYSKQTIEYIHLNISMFITGTYKEFLLGTPCFNDYELYINRYTKDKAREETYGTFDASDDGRNYFIGYLPELRQIKRAILFYRQHINAKPLCVVCSKYQQELYETIFKELKEEYPENKLEFILTEFSMQKGGDID